MLMTKYRGDSGRKSYTTINELLRTGHSWYEAKQCLNPKLYGRLKFIIIYFYTSVLKWIVILGFKCYIFCQRRSSFVHFLLLRIIGFCVDNGSVHDYDAIKIFIEVFPLTAVTFFRLQGFFLDGSNLLCFWFLTAY